MIPSIGLMESVVIREVADGQEWVKIFCEHRSEVDLVLRMLKSGILSPYFDGHILPRMKTPLISVSFSVEKYQYQVQQHVNRKSYRYFTKGDLIKTSEIFLGVLARMEAEVAA